MRYTPAARRRAPPNSRLPHRPHLDRVVGEEQPLSPRDRLGHVVAGHDEVAGDDLLRFGEWAVRHDALAVLRTNRERAGRRAEATRADELPLLGELEAELVV